MILVVMKLFDNDESLAGSWCAPFKEAAPKVRLNCDDALSKRHDGKTVPKDLLQLHKLVANPSTEEHIWMNACIGAGTRSLTPQRGLLAKMWDTAISGIAFNCYLLTAILAFPVSLFVLAQLSFFSLGISVDSFIRPFSAPDCMGLLVAVGSAICFWTSLLFQLKSWRWLAAVPAIGAVWIGITLGAGWTVGYGLSIAFATVTALAMGGLCYAGYLCRETLPKSFDAIRMVKCGLPYLCFPAVLSAWILFEAFSTPTHSSTYSNGTSGGFLFLAAIVVYCFFAPGLAIGMSSKSTSRAAGAFLSVLVQAPLLLSFTVVAGLSVLFGSENVDPGVSAALNLESWKALGLERAAFFLAGALVATKLAAAGGSIGVWVNEKRFSRKCK